MEIDVAKTLAAFSRFQEPKGSSLDKELIACLKSASQFCSSENQGFLYQLPSPDSSDEGVGRDSPPPIPPKTHQIESCITEIERGLLSEELRKDPVDIETVSKLLTELSVDDLLVVPEIAPAKPLIAQIIDKKIHHDNEILDPDKPLFAKLLEAAREGRVLNDFCSTQEDFEKTVLHWIDYFSEGAKALLLKDTYNDIEDALSKKDQSGLTALHYAVFSKNPNIIKFFLEKGADPRYEERTS